MSRSRTRSRSAGHDDAPRRSATTPVPVPSPPAEPLASLTVDEDHVFPPWLQIKEQIRVAYSAGRLRAGDVLPSIRSLSRHLGVTSATVRRAYDDLSALGFLSSEPRKHVMVLEGLGHPPESQELLRNCSDECARIVGWARRNRISAISFARLFLQRASEMESADPSYVFVDASAAWASHFASVVAHAWEVKVQGASLDEVAAMSHDEVAGFTAILVNAYRVERFRELVTRRDGVFPVRMSVHRKLLRRIERLPRSQPIRLVVADEDAARISAALRQYFREEIATERVISILPMSDIRRWDAMSRGVGIVIVSHNVWSLLPESVRRSRKVVPSELEIEMESLERVRLLAGVLV